MSQLPPPPPGFNVDPPPAGFQLDRPANAVPPPPPGFVPEQQSGVPSNFVPPTAGGQIDTRLLELAQSMPDTRFDFSDYNQSDPTGGRAQLPSLLPQQQAEQNEFERLVGRVTPIVNDPRNPVGQATNQLLIEDANVTPIEFAGGYENRQNQLQQEALERTPRAVRPIATGFLQSGLSTGALLGQVSDAIGATEGLADSLNEETARLSENRRALGTSTFENVAEGMTRSFTDLFTLGGPTFLAGPNAGAFALRMTQAAPAISAFTAKAMNDAEYRGSQAGLSGGELAQYVLTQGAIEGVTTTVFSAVGLGGFENLKGAAGNGVREAFKQFGIQAISEVGEENLIGIMSAVTDAVSGVDPEATSPERMKQLVAETTLATLMTMGLAEGSQRTINWSRGQQQAQTAQDPVADQDRGTRSFGPVQGPQQLALPTGVDIAERKAADARAALGDAQAKLASEQAALAQQAPGEGTITVDPEGRAATPTQQAQIDQFVQETTTPQITVPLLESRTGQARFIVDEQGQTQDLQPAQQSPQADESVRRSQSTTDAVTEEADAIINDMRKRNDVSEADEARIRELVNEARRNPLTGGMNRNAFSKVFDAVRTRARKSKKPMSIIAIDAKNLKIYNDQISESAGDEYLRRAQKVLENALRGSDEGRDRIGDAFHYGGDEWAIILPDTDAKGAEVVRDRIEEAFGSTQIVPGVSDGLVGGITEINPNSRKKMRAFLDDAVKEMKVRKTEQKRAAGEATTREEAEARAAQAASPTPAPVFKRASAGVKDAAAAVARAKRDVERTAEVVNQLKAEQEAAVANNEPGASNPSDLDEVADVNTPPGMPKVVSQSVIRRGASYVGTPMGYALERWVPRLYTRIKQLEAEWRTERHEAYHHVHEFRRAWKGKAKMQAWPEYLYLRITGQPEAARQFLSERFPEDAAKMDELAETVKNVADANHGQLAAARGDIGYLENHFPGRSVLPNMYSEYMEVLHGPDASDELFLAIKREEAKQGRALTVEEKVELSNRLISLGRPPKRPGSSNPRELGKRTVEDLDFETFQKYYDTSFDSIYRYFDTVIYNTKKAQLFGKASADESTAETIGRMFVEGRYGLDKLTPYQRNKVRSLITSRFGSGELSVGLTQKTIRDIGYAAYLGDMWSTATQLLDVVNVAVRDGAIPTLRAIPAAVRQSAALSAQKHGLRNVREEYSGSVSGTGKLLELATKLNLFSFADERALTISMNSALTKARSDIKKNERRFRQKWNPYFGPAEMNALVEDIRAKRASDLAYLYAYMRASETRPMDVWDTPQAYADSPKLRWMYQFKMFPLKQFNLVRRQGYDKIAKGVRTNNPRLAGEGMAGLVRAMMLLGLAGAGLDWLKAWVMGQERELSDLVLNNLLFTHMGSTFMLRNAGENGPGGAAVEMFIPPAASVIDNLWKTTKGENVTAIKHTPIVGRTWYALTDEGRDKEARRARTTYRDKARDAYLAGDSAGAHTYVRQYNQTMKDLGRDERLSMVQVQQAAKRKKDGAQ